MSFGQRCEEIRRGKPLERKAGLKAGKALERTGPLPRKNVKRRKSEFARCYGSKARVEWVKSLPCTCCRQTMRNRVNAHLPSRSGMGRKGDFAHVIPLCPPCHAELDEGKGVAWLECKYRVDLTEAARRTEEAWQSHETGVNDAARR